MIHVVRNQTIKRYIRGLLVVDEMCRCGLKKSEHSPSVQSVGRTLAVSDGHGDAPGCPQFTWKSFVLEDGSTA